MSGLRNSMLNQLEVHELSGHHSCLDIILEQKRLFLTLFFGIYPDPLLNTIDVSINNLIDKHQIEMKFYLGDRNI